MRKRIAVLYALLLMAHAAHVGEEFFGRFWLVGVFGPVLFLALNAALFCVPAALFFSVLKSRRGAYILSLVYAGFMAAQGIGHNAATLITGRYRGGFAGGISGLALLLIGVPLFLALKKGMPPAANAKPGGSAPTAD